MCLINLHKVQKVSPKNCLNNRICMNLIMVNSCKMYYTHMSNLCIGEIRETNNDMENTEELYKLPIGTSNGV